MLHAERGELQTVRLGGGCDQGVEIVKAVGRLLVLYEQPGCLGDLLVYRK